MQVALTHNKLFYALLATFVLAPLPLGSNRIWAAMLLVTSTGCLLAAWLLDCYRGNQTLTPAFYKAKPALIALLLLQLWVLFQCLPLPAFFTTASSNLYQAAGVSGFSPISLSPAYSFYALLLGLGYSMAFILVLLLVDTREKLKLFALCLVYSGVFQAIYGSYMVLSGVEQLLFVHKWAGEGVASGTFVNRNHFAAYLGVALSMGVGLLLAEWQRSYQGKSRREVARDIVQLLLSEKAQLRLFLAIMVIGLVMTHSRMGNIAFVSALLMTGVVFIYKTRRFNTKVLAFFVSILVIDAFIIGNWFGLEELVDRLEKTEIQKEQRVDLNFAAAPMVNDFMLVGSGANTMPQTMPVYMLEQAAVPFEHVHNDYVEMAITLGLFGSACLAAFLFFILKQLFTQRKLHYGVFMMLAYMALHSFADFNLYIPAIAFTVCALLALVYVEPNKKKKKRYV